MSIFKSKRKKYAAIVIVVVIISIFVFSSLRKNGKDNETQSVVPKAVKVLEMDKGKQSTAQLQKTVLLSSTNSAEAISEYSGRIKKINFEVGDFVRAGQVLAEFDQSGVSNTAKNTVESLQEVYDLTKKTLKRTKETAEKSIEIAKKNVNKAEIELDQAEDGGDADEIDLAEEDLKIAKKQEDQVEANMKNQIKAAEIQLEQAKLSLKNGKSGYDKTFIKAPISGNIVSKNISLDDYLSSNQTIAQIVKPGKLEAKIYLTKNEVLRVKEEDEITIKRGDIEVRGRVRAIAKLANMDNQRFEVLIESNDKISEFINQNVKVSLNLRLKGNEGFFVPLESVNVGQKKKEVFVVENKKAISREVKTGNIIGNKIEILEGLNQGDILIVYGNKNLRDNEEVSVK